MTETGAVWENLVKPVKPVKLVRNNWSGKLCYIVALVFPLSTASGHMRSCQRLGVRALWSSVKERRVDPSVSFLHDAFYAVGGTFRLQIPP